MSTNDTVQAESRSEEGSINFREVRRPDSSTIAVDDRSGFSSVGSSVQKTSFLSFLRRLEFVRTLSESCVHRRRLQFITRLPPPSSALLYSPFVLKTFVFNDPAAIRTRSDVSPSLAASISHSRIRKSIFEAPRIPCLTFDTSRHKSRGRKLSSVAGNDIANFAKEDFVASRGTRGHDVRSDRFPRVRKSSLLGKHDFRNPHVTISCNLVDYIARKHKTDYANADRYFAKEDIFHLQTRVRSVPMNFAINLSRLQNAIKYFYHLPLSSSSLSDFWTLRVPRTSTCPADEGNNSGARGGTGMPRRINPHMRAARSLISRA